MAYTTTRKKHHTTHDINILVTCMENGKNKFEIQNFIWQTIAIAAGNRSNSVRCEILNLPCSKMIARWKNKNCARESIIYITKIRALNRERPYQHDSTASRLLSEVKHVRAWLVLRWGTTLESQVLFSFTFCLYLLLFFYFYLFILGGHFYYYYYSSIYLILPPPLAICIQYSNHPSYSIILCLATIIWLDLNCLSRTTIQQQFSSAFNRKRAEWLTESKHYFKTTFNDYREWM
jgi:hypothetical protein